MWKNWEKHGKGKGETGKVEGKKSRENKKKLGEGKIYTVVTYLL